MLRAIATLTVALVGLQSPNAFADGPSGHGPVTVSGDYRHGSVTTVVKTPARHGGVVIRTAASSSEGSTCSWEVIYFVAQLPLRDKYPGTWYGEYCGGTNYVAVVFVPKRASNGPLVQATPTTVAQQAMKRLPLPQPGVEHNPSGDALVNLATWWWIDPGQWRSLTQRTAVGPVWARVTARPVKSMWDAGDGTPPLTCRGGGTPYNRNEQASAQSTDCSHTYTESSAGQPQTGPDPNDRFFTVTVTVFWQVTFVGAGGARGALPVMTRTTRFPLRVDERQTVVTGGSG